MNIRRGSTVYAAVLSMTGLIVAGVGGYAAYNKLTGNCESCTASPGAGPVEPTEMPSCCAGHKPACGTTLDMAATDEAKPVDGKDSQDQPADPAADPSDKAPPAESPAVEPASPANS